VWLPRVAMAASGGGSTIRRILPEVLACNGQLYGHIQAVLLVVDRPCNAKNVWKGLGMPASHIVEIAHGDPDMALKLAEAFETYGIDLFSGHGFLSRVPVEAIPNYTDRHIVYMNQHPAPKPLVGGEGFWGKVPHSTVALYNERSGGKFLDGTPLFTEAWQHYIDAEFDTGAGISVLTLPLFGGDCAESIQERVMESEWRNCIEAYKQLASHNPGERVPTFDSCWNEQTIDLELLEQCRQKALALGPH